MIRRLLTFFNSKQKVSRDGTEIEPEVGRLLLQAWEVRSHSSPNNASSLVCVG